MTNQNAGDYPLNWTYIIDPKSTTVINTTAGWTSMSTYPTVSGSISLGGGSLASNPTTPGIIDTVPDIIDNFFIYAAVLDQFSASQLEGLYILALYNSLQKDTEKIQKYHLEVLVYDEGLFINSLDEIIDRNRIVKLLMLGKRLSSGAL